MTPRRFLRGWVPLLLLALLVVMLATNALSGPSEYGKKDLSFVQQQIDAGKVDKASIQDSKQIIRIETADGKYEASYVTNQAVDLADSLKTEHVDYSVSVDRGNLFVSILLNLLPLLLVLFLLFFLMNQMQGGGNRVMNFGKSKAKLVNKDTPKTTFADVAGSDEAIEELHEIKEFLENPGKFQAIGAKIPKGVLLYGPPGTGKTLLARAVAGEAGVPFYSISGSDFVEMFVGVGASRVRDLFEQAKANAPAIIFVDEIDAVGRHRGAGLGGGHDEREQTLNQLLVEMDGFDVKGGVILIAATNRPEHPRPGAAAARPFRPPDRGRPTRPAGPGSHPEGPRQGQADRPGRRHARHRPPHSRFHRCRPGERAERGGATDRPLGPEVHHLDAARGVDRPRHGWARAQDPRDRRRKEDHRLSRGRARPGRERAGEPGPGPQDHNPASGRALGYTMQLPLEDSTSRPARRCWTNSRCCWAVERPRNSCSTSPRPVPATTSRRPPDLPSHDHAVRDQRQARCSEVRQQSGEVFLGRDIGHQRDYSEQLPSEIDAEVRRLIEAAHDEASKSWSPTGTSSTTSCSG